MNQISKEEIARVDRAHRRADEAVEQIEAGHIITECVVLYPEENAGDQVTWTAAELEAWVYDRGELISSLKRRSGAFDTAIMDHEGDISGARYGVAVLSDGYWAGLINRARVVYRQSAIYLAANPPADPYTLSDRAGLR